MRVIDFPGIFNQNLRNNPPILLCTPTNLAQLFFGEMIVNGARHPWIEW
ncbi:MAG: hypothetical protein F6J98_13455 [Moorea sp. SIO4G2]|nr:MULTISPECIES: hypothetical protein [unclassified Moorena]NEO61382.1 hypothetical protein [Moorena sp. SIO4G2]NEO05374.1 hypothetical protein [Moorena sp. SIO3I8]NEO24850.1 hypothetical protein [Moorena sp. SIO4A5]NEP22539.1 hypothetical protein [Moorena sp. SIO3I6]NEQ58218.1 hypothetical protein [Moorena sp. SIO4A1]